MSNQITDTEWNAGVIYARRAVLANFLIEWAAPDEGIQVADRRAIEYAEIILCNLPDPEARQSVLYKLAMDWAETDLPLDQEEQDLIARTDRRLQSLNLIPLAS